MFTLCIEMIAAAYPLPVDVVSDVKTLRLLATCVTPLPLASGLQDGETDQHA